MKVCFTAFGVPVLNFSHKPDSVGSIFPPEAHATFKDIVPVTFGGGGRTIEMPVGHVRLYRKDNTVYGDFTLYSVWGDDQKALAMIRELRPAASLLIEERVGQACFKFKIDAVIVTGHKNHDLTIEPFGAKVLKRPPKAEMN